MSYFFPKLCLVASLALIPNLHAGFLSTIVSSVSSEPISEEEKAHPQAYEYYKSGIKKHDAKDYQGAIEEFTRVIALDPKFAEAYKQRGASTLIVDADGINNKHEMPQHRITLQPFEMGQTEVT